MEVVQTLLVLVAGLAALVLCWLALKRPRPAEDVAASTSAPRQDREAPVQQNLVQLVDVLFALVLTLPVITQANIIRAPWQNWHANVTMLVATLLGYYVVIRSYIDWHIAMADAPYKIRTEGDRFRELIRVYVDLLIVGSYVMLFLAAGHLARHPGGDLRPFLLFLALIVLLYIAWGVVRRRTYKTKREYKRPTLIIVLVGLLAICGAYWIDHSGDGLLAHHGTARDLTALGLALAVWIAYRKRNWSEIPALAATA